jgi:hypothetical protein
MDIRAAGYSMLDRTKHNFKKEHSLPATFSKEHARKKRRELTVQRAKTLFKEKPVLLDGHAIGIDTPLVSRALWTSYRNLSTLRKASKGSIVGTPLEKDNMSSNIMTRKSIIAMFCEWFIPFQDRQHFWKVVGCCFSFWELKYLHLSMA